MAPQDRRFLAIVPAYNESGSVVRVITALDEDAPGFDVVVVDDGSTDGTAEQALQAGASVVRLPFNLGIGGAVQTGFLYALQHGYDYAAQVDGDGQHEAAELHKLVAAMQSDPQVDVVCGSRFLSAEHRYPAPISRRTGVHMFSFALRLLLRQPVSDPTSGFRLYNRRAIVLFARDYPHDYPEVEAILMLKQHRLRMAEIPVRMQLRGTGRSSITKARSLYYMVKVSLALIVGMMRHHAALEPGDPSPVSGERGI